MENTYSATATESENKKTPLQTAKKELSHEWNLKKQKNIPENMPSVPRDYGKIKKLHAQINILKQEENDSKKKK